VRKSKARAGSRRPIHPPPRQDAPGADETEDTSWFYSPEWQAGEQEADEQTRAGQIKTFESVEDLLADLHKEAAE
jgi:hypothetical protein